MVEESVEMVEESLQITDLCCTICGHDLNNPSYQICQHPIIPVAVCIICIDEIDNRLKNIFTETEKEISKDIGCDEYCSWCINGEDTLYLCGPEDASSSCHHAFCSSCLLTNLGEPYVKYIDSISSWSCLVCDITPLSKLTTAMTSGQELSIYHESFLSDSIEVFNDNDEKEVTTDIARLQFIVGECTKAQEMLENDHLIEKEMEIREEYFKSSPGRPSALRAQEELQVYTGFWKMHIDIMQRQEADLFEKISYQGYDLTSLPMYDIEEETLLKKMEPAQIREYIVAEKAITERLNQQAALRNEEEKNENEGDFKQNISWLVVGNDVMKMDEEAIQDALVQKYKKEPDISWGKYPHEFKMQVPERVLKALFYCDSTEFDSLANAYSVPAHIRIVMKYAVKRFPQSVKKWSIADTVHPAVLKAIFFANNRMEWSVLCDAYPELDREPLLDVTDIGSSSDVYEMYCRRKKESKGGGAQLVLFMALIFIHASYQASMRASRASCPCVRCNTIFRNHSDAVLDIY